MRGKGFTLVELLVTISILAILMTIAIISYSGIQKNARDAKRKSDISIIQSALEQYHADQGFYPTSVPFGTALPLNNPTNTKTYLQKIPQDVLSPSFSYSYVPRPMGPIVFCNNEGSNYCTNYCLFATVENISNIAIAVQCSSSTNQYQVQAP